jgi:hypothetical protein
VITRAQLLALGFTDAAIRQRLANGRLHPVYRGVYAVGRRELGRLGRWIAAILACGPGAVLIDTSAAALWEIGVEIADGIASPFRVTRRADGQGSLFTGADISTRPTSTGSR